MLTKLHIQNLATVKEVELHLKSGFTVITGETGAGKSVLLKALGLILGAKSSKDLVRSGERFTLVTANFKLQSKHPALALLTEWEFPLEESLQIQRKVSQTGKSSALLNGFPATASQLAELGGILFDLQGQHAQTELSSDETHQGYLDDFATAAGSLAAYREVYTQLRSKEKELAELLKKQQEEAQKKDYLQFQCDEIHACNLSVKEEDELTGEVEILSKAETLQIELAPIADWMEGESSPLDQMTANLQALQKFSGLSATLEEAKNEVESGLISLREAASSIQRYLGGLEVNPARLDQVHARLSEYDKLKRKYGPKTADVILHAEKIEHELDQFLHLDENTTRLTREIAELQLIVSQKADALTHKRAAKQAEFGAKIKAVLEVLGMEKSKFEVELEPCKRNLNGQEKVSFLISTNPGQPLKPLVKIASGGEISRVMLALKSALSDLSEGVSLFFDEIDTGISGRVASRLAEKLGELAGRTQVFAITHSPQVAALGDHHLLVEKEMTEDSSTTTVRDLEEGEKIAEIAKFLGGSEVTENAIAAAREMRP